MNIQPTKRPYVSHRWISVNGGKAKCFVCGISETTWERKTENDALINWDCYAVRVRKSPKQ